MCFLRSRHVLLLVGLMAAVLWQQPASAAESSDKQMQRMFAKAQALYDSGTFAKALPLFSDLLQLSKSPNARLYVARCLRELNRLGAAYNQMHTTARVARDLATTNDRYRATRDAAASELMLLEPRVGRILVRHKNRPPTFRVELDGVDMQIRKVEQPIAVTPGSYDLLLLAAAREPLRLRGNVAAGDIVVAEADWRTATHKGEKTGDSSPSPLGPMRIVGLASLGLGFAGLASFGVMGFRAKSRYAQLEEACTPAPCPQEYQSYVDGGRQMATAANVALGLGLAATATGVGLLIFGGGESAEGKKQAIRLLPYHWGLRMKASF